MYEYSSLISSGRPPLEPKIKKRRNKLCRSVGGGRRYRSRIGELSTANRNKRKFSPPSSLQALQPGSGSLRLRGCNKRPDFHRNDQQLTNQAAVRPHLTISATLFRYTMISYDTIDKSRRY